MSYCKAPLGLAALIITVLQTDIASADKMSSTLLEKIQCRTPFSVAATFLDLNAAGYVGIKFADYDSASCFTLAKPLDLLDSDEAPIEYICFSDALLFQAAPDLFTRGPGTQTDFIAIGFTDKGEAIEYIWQDDGTELPTGFSDERDRSKFFPSQITQVKSTAEWSCFPPSP